MNMKVLCPCRGRGDPEWWRGTSRVLSFLLCLLPLPVTLPQILIPALMVTAEKDPVLVPEMSKHMEDWVRDRSCSGVIGASHQRAQASWRKDGS